MIITDLEEYPVECFGTNTGKIEIFARGGTPPYLYKLDGGTFSGSNTISNLSTGTHTVVVRDANGWEAAQTSDIITQPKQMIVNYDLDAGNLTVNQIMVLVFMNTD